MPDIIIDYPDSDYVMIDGVCYEFIEFVPDADVEAVTIQGTFESCDECLFPDTSSSSSQSSSSSSVIVPFPAACAGCGSAGDVHWVFGNPTDLALGVTNASFNVDDNSSTSEIVWFAFTEGATEYSIKYTQQEFEYTAGGKSINQITISETGQPDIVYSLTGSQDGTLKDGSPFGGSDVFVIGSNVAQVSISERIIDSTSNCCIPPGSFFGMLGIDVHFNDGLYGVDSVGGALWYIWKTAKDESGAVNNLSMEGIDGIGDYLNTGSTGFSARSSFEGNAQLEAVDITALQEVSARMTELQGISGLWNADWDPLAEEPYECEIDTCGTPNADPTILVTMSWTDLDDTKNFLGCTWCNGETKNVYATTYTTFAGTTFFGATEKWRRAAGGDLWTFLDQDCSPGFMQNLEFIRYGAYEWQASASFGAGCNFYNSMCDGTGGAGTVVTYPCNAEQGGFSMIPNAWFNESIVTSTGVTISWARGDGW